MPTDRLEASIASLNPALPPEARADTVRRVTQSELPQMLEENRRIHRLLTKGADVEYCGDDGVLTAGKVKLTDFERPGEDDWFAVQQFTVVAGQTKRRPEVVVFVNGLPLAVIKLKAPEIESATLAGPFNQLQTYKGTSQANMVRSRTMTCEPRSSVASYMMHDSLAARLCRAASVEHTAGIRFQQDRGQQWPTT